MKQDSFFYPLKLTLGFLAVVAARAAVLRLRLAGRVEYQNPKYGGGAVEFALPKKEGYAK